MDTQKILEAMRILSDGRSFMWAKNDLGSMLVELKADVDPRDVGDSLVRFAKASPLGARFFLWDGNDPSELTDVEEAFYVAEHRIRQLRDEYAIGEAAQ